MNVAGYFISYNNICFPLVFLFSLLCLLPWGRGNRGNLKILLTTIFQELSHKTLGDSRAETRSWPEAGAAAGLLLQVPRGERREERKICRPVLEIPH